MQAVYPNQASVLILDDDAALRSAYVRVLGDAGYYCKEFESLPQFIEAIEKSSLELDRACCLLDMKMSAGSGLEAQAWLAERKIQLPDHCNAKWRCGLSLKTSQRRSARGGN